MKNYHTMTPAEKYDFLRYAEKYVADHFGGRNIRLADIHTRPCVFFSLLNGSEWMAVFTMGERGHYSVEHISGPCDGLKWRDTPRHVAGATEPEL